MNLMNKIILLLLILLIWKKAEAQPSPFDQNFVNSITSRLPSMPDDKAKVDNLVRLASMYLFTNPTLAIKYADEGNYIAKKINYPQGQIACLGQSAFYFSMSAEWAKSTVRINEAIPLCKKYEPAQMIYMYNLMVINYSLKQDTALMFEYALKALNHPSFASSRELDKWATYMQLGRAYEFANKLDSARKYASILSYYINKYSKEVPDLASNSYTLFGNIALKEKNYNNASQYFYQAKDYYGLAKTYHFLNQPDSVIVNALKSLRIGEKQNSPLLFQESAKILAQEYGEFDAKKANKYWIMYSDSKDKLYSNEKIKQSELIYLNEQKNEFEIERESTANKNRLMLFSLLAVLALFLLFIFMLWRNNRFKQQANYKLEGALKNLKSTQSQLIQSEKMASLGELTAGIAHEIQNPLNFVNNFSEVNSELIQEMKEEIEKGNLGEVKGLANDIADNEQKINHHGKRADAIVKGMLQHSRSSSGVKEPANINVLADEYLRLAYHGLRAKDKSFNATMKTDFDETIGNINIIPQDIGRVILNLITNAFYAVTEKKKQLQPGYEPTVSVSTKKQGDRVLISVKDNGDGIPQKILDKVFQPFFTTKPTGEGTGLGLSMSYEIVTKGHSGELKINTKEGEGTEFTIHLPV